MKISIVFFLVFSLFFGFVGHAYSAASIAEAPIGFVFLPDRINSNNSNYYLSPSAAPYTETQAYKITGSWDTQNVCPGTPSPMADQSWIYGTINWLESGTHYCGNGPPYIRHFATIATTTDPVTPATPAHCSDGILNEGEMGIDCGGTCPNNACTPVCPPGSRLLDNDWSAPDGGCKGLPNKMGCWHEAPKDRYGNCPVGYTPIYEACGRDPSLSFGCIALKDPVLAADPDQVLDPLENPWSGTGITTTESSTTTEAPNALGGVDQTMTKTATDSEGNATTETTTVHKDAAGNEVARETEKTENAPNYDTATLGKTAEDYPTDMPSDFNKSVSFGLDERLTGHASIASIGQTRLQVDSVNSIVDFSFMGNQVTYDLNQGFIVEALSTIGQLLYFIALIGSFFIMFV